MKGEESVGGREWRRGRGEASTERRVTEAAWRRGRRRRRSAEGEEVKERETGDEV